MTPQEATEIIAQSGLVAASRGQLDQVKTILQAQPNLVEALNTITPKPGEETPQRVAALGRHIDIMEYLLAQGVLPDLFMACALGRTDLVGAYLAVHPKDLGAKGAHGVSLLVHANHPEMVELLLSRGIDATNALCQLAWSGRVELMKIAIAHGAVIDPPGVGRRAIHIAAAQGHTEAVQLLLSLGTNAYARAKGDTWEFKTPLALALMNNHHAIVDMIRKVAPPRVTPPRRVPLKRK